MIGQTNISDKPVFSSILKQGQRKVVIHHTHLISDICSLLKPNDLLFFDDCLYSQYVWIKKYYEFLLNNNITIVLGFSTYLYREENEQPIEKIESYRVHNQCNRYIQSRNDTKKDVPLMSAFMTISEIKELLKLRNCYLAFHGCCHLDIDSYSNLFEKLIHMSNDIKDGLQLLSSYGLATNIMVFPYAQYHSSFKTITDHYNLQYLYAIDNSRISIEELNNDSKI